MSVNKAVEAIIRPPRTTYDLNKLPKVLETDDEEDGGGLFIRIPFEIKLPRKLKMRGSIYHTGLMNVKNPGPCLIYLHGNASSQLEGQFLVPNICPRRVFVVCFDAIGCGMSDGEYVSLGYYETGDTEFLIKYLQDTYHFGPFVLWGRSMGAATSLMIDNPAVVGIVSDSAFTSVRNMVKAIARQHHIGTVFMKPTLWMLKGKVEEKAGFDFNTVSPINVVPNRKTPIIFAQATDDKLIPFEHCEQLYEAYGGSEKRLIKLTGGHNGRRPLEFIRDGVKFALEKFGLPSKGLIISPCRNLQKSDFHFESFDQMVGNTNGSFNAASLQKEIQEEEDNDNSSLSFHLEEEDGEAGGEEEYWEEESFWEEEEENQNENKENDQKTEENQNETDQKPEEEQKQEQNDETPKE